MSERQRTQQQSLEKTSSSERAVNPSAPFMMPLLQRALTYPDKNNLTPAVVKRLQRTHGNQFVQRLVNQQTSPPKIQRQFNMMEEVESAESSANRLNEADEALRDIDPDAPLTADEILNVQSVLLQMGLLTREAMDEESPSAAAPGSPSPLTAYPQTLRGYRLARNVEMLRASNSVLSDEGRQAFADEINEYGRELLESYPDKIQRFIQQPGMEDDEKVRVIGEISAQAARLQFLVGSMYYGGSGSDQEWEETNNRGHMIDQYILNSSRRSPWCAMFASWIVGTVTGARTGVASGAKIGWGRRDWNFDEDTGGVLTNRVSQNPSTNENSGNYNPWAALRQTLNQIDDGEIEDQTKEEAVDQFFETVIRPQAGDIMVVRRPDADPNAFREDDPNTSSNEAYQSHTTMVERLSGHTLYTIEGNKGDRVTGRAFDLTNPEHVAEITLVARASLKTFDSDYETPEEAAEGDQPTEATPASAPDAVTEEELLAPLQRLNEMLQDLATDAGMVNAGEAGAPVANIAQETPSATTGSSE